MPSRVPPRSEIPVEFTWDLTGVYPSDKDWEQGFHRVEQALPELERFRGRLDEGPSTLADWFQSAETVLIELGKVVLYASSLHNVDTTDQLATARHDRATGLFSRV